MLRNISGSLLALIGAVLAVWSPFRVWYGGRQGSDIRVDDLFTGAGVSTADATPLGSLLLPFAFAALLALLGVLLRSRLAVGAAGVLVLGVTVLWTVRQGQAAGQLTLGGDGLDVGAAAAFGGGALLLLGCSVMRGRSLPHTARVAVSPPASAPAAPYVGAPAVPAVPAVPSGAPPPVPPYEPACEPPYDGPAGGPWEERPHRSEDDDTLTLPALPDAEDEARRPA
jgi:hypothetical protein